MDRPSTQKVMTEAKAYARQKKANLKKLSSLQKAYGSSRPRKEEVRETTTR